MAAAAAPAPRAEPLFLLGQKAPRRRSMLAHQRAGPTRAAMRIVVVWVGSQSVSMLAAQPKMPSAVGGHQAALVALKSPEAFQEIELAELQRASKRVPALHLRLNPGPPAPVAHSPPPPPPPPL